ncbi:hypothetical protein L1887_31127 [Cichorium endivia]|nr:hypothetical protein L1887_31127 [Cichorium endivia]
MAFPSSSSISKNRHTTRSISLPPRSHPSTLQVQEELNNLKTWESSTSHIHDAETISSGVTCLERLYTCVDDLLSLPLTQQALSNHQHEKLVNELLDRSMKLLDICGSVRDLVSQVKEHVRDFQSALRRKKRDFVVDDSFLKKLKKDAIRAVADLKQIDIIYGSKPLNLDPHLSSVIRVVRDVSDVSISVFGLLLSYLHASIPKQNSVTKWSMVSKFIQKGAARRKDQPEICVESLEFPIEGIENGLECMFRRLIRTRASLLNILSH